MPCATLSCSSCAATPTLPRCSSASKRHAAGLRETLKMQNVATDLVAAVKTIQSYGMVTVAGMIIGFDSDDPQIFDDQYAFLQEHGLLSS